MSVNVKKYVPLLILGTLGSFMVLSYFVSNEVIGFASRELQNYSVIISTIALGFGPFALFRQHIPRSRKGNPFSAVLLIGMVGMPLLYFITGSTISIPYDWIYRSIVVPLDSSTYCLVAFAIVAGCFRAFRVRNIDSFLVLFSAIILLIGKVPIGAPIKFLSDWFMVVPNTAGYRGIQIGIGLGLFAYALRIIMGIERAWLAEVGEE